MDNAHMIYVYTYPRWQVLSAEMDCALQDERQPQCKQGPPQMGLMVELKTSRQIENDRMRFSFQRYKMLSWWIQSFLAGVPRITVGWRDDDGLVRKIEHIETMKIPKLANADCQKWSYKACIGFTNRILDWLQHNTKDQQRYSLRYRPSRGQERFVELENSNREGSFLSDEERLQLRKNTQFAKKYEGAPGHKRSYPNESLSPCKESKRQRKEKVTSTKQNVDNFDGTQMQVKS